MNKFHVILFIVISSWIMQAVFFRSLNKSFRLQWKFTTFSSNRLQIFQHQIVFWESREASHWGGKGLGRNLNQVAMYKLNAIFISRSFEKSNNMNRN